MQIRETQEIGTVSRVGTGMLHDLIALVFPDRKTGGIGLRICRH